MLKKVRIFVALMAWPLALGVAGCDCDNSGGPGMDADVTGDNGVIVCCENSQGQDVCQPVPFCGSPFLCGDGQLQEPSMANDCRFIAPLDPGQLATHLDIASDAEGTVFLSGYTAGRSPTPQYGDLVFGTVSGGAVTWSIVDGVPAGTPVAESGIVPDEDGWRGGITAQGDNVGEWNAIALTPGGDVAISYYDKTNSALKYATSSDEGVTWSIHTVYATGDAGQFTSLAFLADGRPAISFLSLTTSSDPAVMPTSVVRVAVATSSSPAADMDWVVTAVGSASDTDCWDALCEGDLVCREDGGCAAESAAPATDCSFLDDEGATQPGCDEDYSCVSDASGGNFSCQLTRTGTPIEDVPVVNGLYTSLRATSSGLALVWHDRLRRTLRGSAYDSSSGMWRAPFAIDGFDSDAGAGDAGYNADLFVAASGDWYVAYVEGVTEELRLATIEGDSLGNPAPTITIEMVDDGVRGTSPPHLIGADADVAVTSTGEVRIVYQDETTQEALVATRPAASMEWTLQGGEGNAAPLDTADATGFWTCQSLSGDTSNIATWWLNPAAGTNGTRVFTIP